MTVKSICTQMSYTKLYLRIPLKAPKDQHCQTPPSENKLHPPASLRLSFGMGINRRPKSGVRGGKTCPGCKQRFGTKDDCRQHQRVCARVKDLNQKKARIAKREAWKARIAKEKNIQTQFKMLGYKIGGEVFLAGPKRKPKPPRNPGNTKWKTFFAFAKGRVVKLWGTVNRAGNMVICLKKWPSKCEIEVWFGICNCKGRAMFDEHGDVVDRWGAAIEFL